MLAQPIMPNDLTVQSPTPSRREIDSEYVAIDLPSGYKFYDFKTLYIRPFKMKHIRKLIQGQANKNIRYMAEVINSCITADKPYPDLVFRLTREDFTYLQYWQRLHSFTAMPFVHLIECTNPKHIQDVAEGKLPKKSLTFTQSITKSTLNVEFLDLEKDYSFSPDCISPSLRERYPSLTLHQPLMSDYLDMMDQAEKEISEDKEEGQLWFLTGIVATRVSIKDESGNELSFKEKFDIIDDLDPDSFFLLKQSEEQLPEYGVNEWITCRCPRCGAVTKTKVILTAHSFLPSNQFARSFK